MNEQFDAQYEVAIKARRQTGLNATNGKIDQWVKDFNINTLEVLQEINFICVGFNGYKNIVISIKI